MCYYAGLTKRPVHKLKPLFRVHFVFNYAKQSVVIVKLLLSFPSLPVGDRVGHVFLHNKCRVTPV